MAITVVTPPALSVLTINEVEKHLRLDLNSGEASLPGYIAAATALVEFEVGGPLLNTRFRETFTEQQLCDKLFLGKRRVIQIHSVKYSYEDSVLTDFIDFKLMPYGDEGYIRPRSGYSWPTQDYLEIEYTAGFGSLTGAIPDELKQWMLLQIGTWYENREAATDAPVKKSDFVDCLLNGYRVVKL